MDRTRPCLRSAVILDGAINELMRAKMPANRTQGCVRSMPALHAPA